MTTHVPTDTEILAWHERERAEVIALCERVGYGFTIDVAARAWDAKLEREYGIKHHCASWLTHFAKNLRDAARPKRSGVLRRQRPRGGK